MRYMIPFESSPGYSGRYNQELGVAWAPNDRVQPPRSLMSKHQVKRELMRRRRVAQVGPATINQILQHHSFHLSVLLSVESSSRQG